MKKFTLFEQIVVAAIISLLAFVARPVHAQSSDVNSPSWRAWSGFPVYPVSPAVQDQPDAFDAAASVIGVDSTTVGGANIVLTDKPCWEKDSYGEPVKGDGLAIIVTPYGTTTECFYTNWVRDPSRKRYIVVSLQNQSGDKHMIWIDPKSVDFTEHGIHWMIKNRAPVIASK
jgi:hypothetical protein